MEGMVFRDVQGVTLMNTMHPQFHLGSMWHQSCDLNTSISIKVLLRTSDMWMFPLSACPAGMYRSDPADFCQPCPANTVRSGLAVATCPCIGGHFRTAKEGPSVGCTRKSIGCN